MLERAFAWWELMSGFAVGEAFDYPDATKGKVGKRKEDMGREGKEGDNTMIPHPAVPGFTLPSLIGAFWRAYSRIISHTV